MEDNVTSDAVKDHPAGTGRNGKRVIVGVAAAVAVVLAVGGVCGYRAWEDHRVSVARGACGSAVAAQKKAVDSYRTLLGADATTAALKTDVKAVKDGKTLDALKRAVGAETPAMVKCDASDKTGPGRGHRQGGQDGQEREGGCEDAAGRGQGGRIVEARQDGGRCGRTVQGDGRQGPGR